MAAALGYVIKDVDLNKYYLRTGRNTGEPVFIDEMSYAKVFMYDDSAENRIKILQKIRPGNYIILEF